MIIDVFSHFLTKNYSEELQKKITRKVDLFELTRRVKVPALSDLDVRLRLMDRYPGVVNILTMVTPPLETLVPPEDATEIAKIANDELAEIVAKYPDNFVGAVACLPMNDIDAAIKEAERAINELNLVGVQIFTNVNGEPLDSPKFRPFFEKMAQLKQPIWIHPWDSPIMGIASTEGLPEVCRQWAPVPFLPAIGWPFETTLAVMRLLMSGIFDAYPEINFITHHCGGTIPVLAERILKMVPRIKREHLQRFYNDTATYGGTTALMSGYSFFGPDRLLFGTDMPLGSGMGGYGLTYETIQSVEKMDIPAEDKKKIFEGNARRVINLAV